MLLTLSDMKTVFGMSAVCVMELVYAEALMPYIIDTTTKPAKFAPFKNASEAAMDFLLYNRDVAEDNHKVLNKDELARWLSFWRFFHEDVTRLKKDDLVTIKLFDGETKPHAGSFANYEKRQEVVDVAIDIINNTNENIRFATGGRLNASKIVRIMEQNTKIYWPELDAPVYSTTKLEEIVSRYIKSSMTPID